MSLTYSLEQVHKVCVFCKMQCNEAHAEQFQQRDTRAPKLDCKEIIMSCMEKIIPKQIISLTAHTEDEPKSFYSISYNFYIT